MVFVAADNDADAAAPIIINSLEAEADNPNVSIVVAIDRKGDGNSGYYKVKYDADLTHSAIYYRDVDWWPQAEFNTADYHTLGNFIAFARSRFPAQHYALVIFGHGNGLNGIAHDATRPGDSTPGLSGLSIRDLGQALAYATNGGQDRLDVIMAYACDMGMLEDAYEIRDYARYYVASQNLTFYPTDPKQDTFFLQLVVNSIKADSDPLDLATEFALWYADFMAFCGLDGEFCSPSGSNYPFTISLIDLDRVVPLTSAVSALAAYVQAHVWETSSEVQSARQGVQVFDSSGNHRLGEEDAFIDLYDFASRIQSVTGDATLKSLAQSVMDGVYAARPTGDVSFSHIFGSGYVDCGWLAVPICLPGSYMDVSHSHGISIFFPTARSSYYNSRNYSFADEVDWLQGDGAVGMQGTGTGWGSMLASYFAVTQPGGPDDTTPPPALAPLGKLARYTGTWRAVSSMAEPRHGHAAVLLPDGRVLVASGTSAYSSVDAELYDSRNDSWVSTAPMPVADATGEGSLMVVLSTGKALWTRGGNGALFDPVDDSWAKVYGVSLADWHSATPLLNGQVLFVGIAFDAISYAMLYDANTGTWVKDFQGHPGAANAPHVGQSHAAVRLNDGRVLLAGGYRVGSADISAQVDIYEPNTETWTVGAPMTAARIGHTATVLQDGRVLVAGGSDYHELGSGCYATAEVYDPATDTWGPTGALSEPRCRHTATLLADGRVLLTGGLQGTTYYDSPATPDIYDPRTGTWERNTSYFPSYFGHTATMLPDGRVLVIGGKRQVGSSFSDWADAHVFDISYSAAGTSQNQVVFLPYVTAWPRP